MKIDFSNHPEAEDMVCIICRDKNLSEADAIIYSINEKIYHTILRTGYASIALPLWGHDDPEREWSNMVEPLIEVELSVSQIELLDKIAQKEKVDKMTAVAYFLLFTMNAIGYHI